MLPYYFFIPHTLAGHWKYMPFGCECSNGTGLCESGQGCFWFSQGCTIGCEACDGNGERIPGAHYLLLSTFYLRLTTYYLLLTTYVPRIPGGRNVCNTTIHAQYMHTTCTLHVRIPGGRNVCNTTMQLTNRDPKYRTSARKVPAGSKEHDVRGKVILGE